MHPQQLQRRFSEAQQMHSRGDLLGALRIYEQLARQAPEPVTLTYLALALVQLGRESEALARAEQAQARLPDQGAVIERVTLATVFRRLGRLDQAETLLRAALAAQPGNAGARNNLALVLMQQGKLDEADELFAQAQQELLEDAAPALNRARIALMRQDFAQTEAMLAAARNAQPGHPDLPLVEAKLALAEADHERAAAALFKTLAKQPTHLEAWAHLAACSVDAVPLARLDDLLGGLVRAKPTSARLLGIAVGMARKHLAWKHLQALEQLLNTALESNQDATIEVGAMFLLLSSNISQKAHRIASHNGFETYIARGRHTPRPAPRPLDGRKLRVGYLSSDLRGHAIGYLCVGVMEAHRHDAFEFIAYANWKDDGSEIRRRMRTAFDRFINVTELSDAELAERMRDDGIDLLVDLNQMTAGNRLGVFCHGPAPVTVQWLGMPGTVGAGNRIDYVLLDPWTGHPGNLDGFDEQPVILAGSYQPNDHRRPDLTLGKTRADWGLPEHAPVLCSFNQTQKFSPDTLALWAQILEACPEAVLWVLAGEPALEERFTAIFTRAGIAKERILFAPRVAHDVHIARLQHADLMLDNWPYNAHTTCSDALRAGVPVVTLPGPTFASRVAAGILETAGLADWIADSPEAYVARALAHIQRTRAEIDATKAEVAQRYWSSPMVDCAAFARRLEAFYRAAFERALAGDPPAAAWVGWGGDVHWGLPPAEAWRQTILAQRPDAAAPAAPLASVPSAPSAPSAPSTPADAAKPAAASAPAPAPWTERIAHGTQDARLANLRLLAEEVLALSAPPLCIDVGSLPEDPKPWNRLAQEDLVTVLGFDPQVPDALEGRVRNVACALGDGQLATLRICQEPGMSSCLEPDGGYLARFPMFATWGKVLRTETLPTRRLDEIAEARGARFLKIDTQGSEQLILAHAEDLLAEALTLIELELSPVPLYHGEAGLFATGQWLLERGWVLHTFAHLNKRAFKPFGREEQPHTALRHVFQVDAVFMPHPDRLARFTEERLRALAFIAHAFYGSHDVAMLALDALAEQGNAQPLARYRRYLELAGLDA